ncbi:type I DNA topoisomerase [Rickettsiella endosymbiont of Dermanyssus gallinae]|uniref:type I DNA topoisomerase n=1 Tax=Rickettsiella endosymbiont of Dermanyssus gallinae TaxID=2856608 RepID=UPI001C5293F2|nr:type I DNA topoisomerase [Rickettsiella endosymbiont of Dermanyssus gallinae]
MAKNLLIVESPAKAKTIKKYLGKDFEVLASYGHVRDLLPKEGAVDPVHDFAMTYALIEKNAKHVDMIVKAFKAADALYLATDPDREGEAIAWHVYEILKAKKLLNDKPVYRVVFHEITKAAVKAAVANPREIAMDLVNAQQARRALDYLVGFTLSPLLWKKVRRGLSAGRVQSPALRLIVEREEEIEAFKTQEYWTLTANTQAEQQNFFARLIEYNNEKLEQFSITTQTQAETIKSTLEKIAQGHLLVTKVEKKQRKRNPTAPFTTSTLQQEAGRKLGFTAQRTMRLAQQLYEGIDVGEGAVGLITYMRTDSVHLSNEALESIRGYIVQRYGENEVPESPRQFRTKSRNAQEAHEAIRPTHVEYAPEDIKAHLTPEQRKLYELIWKRAVASQMIHATINTVAVDLRAKDTSDHCFRANGSTIVNPGFMAVYLESQDESKAKSDEEGSMLPPLKEGDVVDLIDISADQHFTEPPPRYSEASLVKALEERDIGRPSTYVPIISTLQNREYVILDQKRFKPTDVGRVVNKFLTRYFMQYVDYDFTARLEDKLDQISRGELEWVPLLKDFWMPFKTLVETTEETVQRKDVTQEALDENCPKCAKPLSIRLGKRGRFIGCSGYPDCDYTRNMEGEVTTASEPEVVEGRVCPDCGHALHIKIGRYGKFIGCSYYPKCKQIEPLEKPADTGIECPECHKGSLLKRKSRYGKIFYSCSTYPTCTYAVWNEPVEQACPRCAWPVMTIKTTKRRGTEKVCPRKECGYAEPMESAPVE